MSMGPSIWNAKKKQTEGTKGKKIYTCAELDAEKIRP
jgi:hypothetical protein